jgi:tetratricopeptide (TPR) repeat protein
MPQSARQAKAAAESERTFNLLRKVILYTCLVVFGSLAALYSPWYQRYKIALPSYEKALEHSEHEEWDDAIALYRVALGSKDEYGYAGYRFAEIDQLNMHNNLGIALGKMERNKEAADQFRQATELDAGSYRSFLNLAKVLKQTGEKGGAIAAFERILTIRDECEPHKSAGKMNSTTPVAVAPVNGSNATAPPLKLNVPPMCVDILLDKKDFVSVVYQAYYHAGVLYKNMQQFVQAEFRLKQALKISQDPEVMMHLGSLYEEMGNLKIAASYYKVSWPLSLFYHRAA